MSSFADLFKDKYKSEKIREYIEEIVREMANLEEENYHAQQLIHHRNRKIEQILLALKELDIPVDDTKDIKCCDLSDDYTISEQNE